MRSLFLFWLLTGLAVVVLSDRQTAIASEQLSRVSATDLRPDATPLDLNILKSENLSAPTTTAAISETQLTIPSLWWMKEQYAAQEEFGDKLIETWVAYPSQDGQPGRVDMVVNRQLWNLLDYLQRYSFIHDFGGAAGDYGYNIRVFDRRANFLAAYTCNFKPSIAQVGQLSLAPNAQAKSDTPFFSTYVQPFEPLTCNTMLDYAGKSGLRGSSFSSPAAGTSTNSDTEQR